MSTKMGAKIHLILLLFIISKISVFGKPAYIETENDCDNEDDGKSVSLGAPILLSLGAKKGLSGHHPIYISPDLEDIIDQQNYNVYHEEVHGTILMPRIKFGLNNEDDCLRSEEDYSDYANIVGDVKTDYYGKGSGSKNLKYPGQWVPVNRKPRYPTSEVDPNAPVRVYPDPNYNPTIEEMIPYAKIRNTPDTYIVMADDPVLVVDSVAKCHKVTPNTVANVPAHENIVGFSGLKPEDLLSDKEDNSTSSSSSTNTTASSVPETNSQTPEVMTKNETPEVVTLSSAQEITSETSETKSETPVPKQRRKKRNILNVILNK